MPELPEAETIVRTLRSRLQGRAVTGASFLSARVSRNEAGWLVGQHIREVGRYGKQILLRLDLGWALMKLGMTGKLLWRGAHTPYTRAVLELGPDWLLFDDIRQFGSIELLAQPPDSLGPDPFEIPPDEFAFRARARRTSMKGLLLNQQFVRGLGNIYADEGLFRAAISPHARSTDMSVGRLKVLHGVLCEMLREAIECGGSSISDYVDGDGRRGSFQIHHQVYGREGKPCFRCASPIVRTVVLQRGTHSCPRCQTD